MLKFDGKWRFTPPQDGKWKNRTIPNSSLDDFYSLIAKTANQGDRQEILEHFKQAFGSVIGLTPCWSSNESWAEVDLLDFMDKATNNAPLFLEAFYEACINLSESNNDIYAPDAEMINDLCIRHNIGYQIKPPKLILRDSELNEKNIQKRESNTVFDFGPIEQSSDEVPKIQVFLCHASGDKPKVRELFHLLQKDGIIPWFDEENLLPGQDWQIEIPRAVRDSDVVIVCLSKASVTKEGYVQKEIRQALDVADEKPEGKIYIIPLKLEECDVPLRLERWQWVNYFANDGYQRLLRSLKLCGAKKNTPRTI